MSRRGEAQPRRCAFVTGPPASGKTSIVKKLVDLALGKGLRVEGFFAPELRSGPARVGFDIQVIGGLRIPLARKGALEWPIKFGSYRVNPEASKVFKEVLPSRLQGCDLLVLDEIGPMELLVDGSRELFLKVLKEGDFAVLGVVHRRLREIDSELYSAVSRYPVYSAAHASPGEVYAKLAEWLLEVASR